MLAAVRGVSVTYRITRHSNDNSVIGNTVYVSVTYRITRHSNRSYRCFNPVYVSVTYRITRHSNKGSGKDILMSV